MSQSYNPIVRRFNEFRAVLLGPLDVGRGEIRPGTPLDALIPVERRRDVWLRLQMQGFRLPPLELPPPERRRQIFGVLRAAVAFAICLERWYGLLVGVPIGVAAYRASRPRAVELPVCLKTVGEAILYTTSVREHKSSGYRWTRNEIAIKVRLIFAEFLGLPLDRVQPENTIIDMVGAG